MIVTTPKEKKKLVKSGRAIRAALNTMATAAKPGVSTLDLDRIGSRVLTEHESKSAPPRVYKFPGNVCISLNSEALHGIPSKTRILQAGDLLKLDLVAELHGWYTDACVTVLVESDDVKCTDTDRRLIYCAQAAFQAGLAVVRPGAKTNEIGIAVEGVAKDYGFSVLEGFGGHGIGKTIHEEPFIPNYYNPECHDVLVEGMVITIEPIICERLGANYKAKDGWTILTNDGGRVAHYEHTMIVMADGPMLVTE